MKLLQLDLSLASASSLFPSTKLMNCWTAGLAKKLSWWNDNDAPLVTHNHLLQSFVMGCDTSAISLSYWKMGSNMRGVFGGMKHCNIPCIILNDWWSTVVYILEPPKENQHTMSRRVCWETVYFCHTNVLVSEGHGWVGRRGISRDALVKMKMPLHVSWWYRGDQQLQEQSTNGTSLTYLPSHPEAELEWGFLLCTKGIPFSARNSSNVS